MSPIKTDCISGDPYINSAINGAIELVGTAMILLAPFMSKHVLLAVSFLFCGVVCLVSTVFIELANGDQGKMYLSTLQSIANIEVLYTSLLVKAFDIFLTSCHLVD